MLLEAAHKKIKNIKKKNLDTNIILLELSSDISPNTQSILKKNSISFKNIEGYINNLITSPDSNYENIKKYTLDLTELAKNNKIDPIIGREHEIKRSIQILSRRTKNNPILIGDPGVGKTAIAEGISTKIIEKQIPEIMENYKLLSLDIASLLSGSKFRGDFEERIKLLLDELDQHENIILFIDEIHTIVGTGANEGSLDIANILKPALARGKLHCIGATTLNEYRKYFEKDSALSRRFQPVYIKESSIEDTILILRGLKEKYEIHHGISISDNAIIAASNLSSRYITNRKLPDKAIDLIDEAASKKRIELKSKPNQVQKLETKILKNEIEIQNFLKEKGNELKVSELKNRNETYNKKLNTLLKDWNLYKNKIDKLNTLKENLEAKKNSLKMAKRKGDLNLAGKLTHYEIPQIEKNISEIEKINKNILDDKKVTEDDIAKIISVWTGVPIDKVLENERDTLKNLNSILHNRVIGQDDAVNAISSVIKRSRTGINDPNKPIGSFLFLGPTGVGKTEVAKTLAEYLFKNEKDLLTFDMSEYSEKHSISKLIGAPPGYVGFENGGRLTKEVRERPFKVILFDEIEKSHPDIFNVFLQMLDEGRLIDGQGNYADFKNTIIILTSNLGSQEILNEENKRYRQELVFKKIKNSFKPEFINRLDDIVIFDKLSKPDIKLIIKNQLTNVQNRLAEKKIIINFDNSIIELLLKKGYNIEYGARPIKRIIEKEIGNVIADKIISKTIKEGSNIILKVKNNKFSIEDNLVT